MNADESNVVVNGVARRIFFLRGHMRSGTNWMCNLLNLHPRIMVDGEFHLEIIKDALDRFTSVSWSMGSHEPMKSIAENWFRDLVRKQLATCVVKRPVAEWLGDRTPAPIQMFLPGAPNIVIVRDGRDVATSWTFHQLRIGGPFEGPCRMAMSNLMNQFLKDPDYFKRYPELLLSCEDWVRECGRRWARYVQNHLQIIQMSRAGEFKGSVLMLRFEDVHEDPETHRRSMYCFLGLDPTEAAPISANTWTSPGFGREDLLSFYRKGEIGDWRNYATDDFCRWFNEEASEELVAMGYVW